jgi:hypothetical protein
MGPQGTPGRGSGLLAWSAAVGVPTALTALHGSLYGRWIVDDAGITFAYARSVATGAGPVLQPGADPVEGYSNPAWMAMLVAGRWLGLFDRGSWFGVPDYVAFPKLLALLCCLGVFWCLYLAARILSSRPVLVTVLAGSVTAAVPAFVIWTVSGLENSLLALAVAGIAALLVRAASEGRVPSDRVAAGCGLLAALAALTRPDGLIYAVALPAAALLTLRRGTVPATLRAAVISLVAFAVPTGAYLGWRLSTFGEYLPNTALAKAQGLPGPESLARPGELLGYIGWVTAILGIVFVGAALASPSRLRSGLIVLLAPLALGLAAFAILEPDWMGQYRFTTPVWPLASLAVTASAVHVVPLLAWRGRFVVVLAAAASVLVSGTALLGQLRTFRADPIAPLCLVAANTGQSFNVYASALGISNGTLLAPDIGGAALTSDLRIVDLAGLADADFAGYWRHGDWEGLRDHVFRSVKPTFVRMHGTWQTKTGLVDDPRLAADYAVVLVKSGTTDLVRRDALPNRPGALADLRELAATVVAPADDRARSAPRSSCGDRLD